MLTVHGDSPVLAVHGDSPVLVLTYANHCSIGLPWALPPVTGASKLSSNVNTLSCAYVCAPLYLGQFNIYLRNNI